MTRSGTGGGAGVVVVIVVVLMYRVVGCELMTWVSEYSTVLYLFVVVECVPDRPELETRSPEGEAQHATFR